MKKKRLTDNLTGYSFILPSAVLLLVFVAIPIVMCFYLSFTTYNGLAAPEWVGLKNFRSILADPIFLKALKNTLRFVVASVPLQTVISLGIAAILAANYRNRFGEFVRGSLFIPVLCSSTLVANIFIYIFSADPDGMANVILSWFGIPKVNWLGNANIAPWVIIGISVWKNVGYFIVIFYSGIMDVPLSLYEAAQLDGAGKWKQFTKITLPNLKSIIFMVITVGTIWSFQFFDLAYVMTSGGPAYSNVSIVYLIYTKAFKDFKLGYACALGVLLFFFMLVVNLLQRVFMKEDK